MRHGAAALLILDESPASIRGNDMCIVCAQSHVYSEAYSNITIGGARHVTSQEVSQISNYLSEGFWHDGNQHARKFVVPSNNVLTYSVEGLDDAGVWFAEQALSAWSAATNLTFAQNNSPSAQIVFGQTDTSGAYAYFDFANSAQTIIGTSHINIPSSWYRGEEYNLNSYSYQTFLHETGHALGLGHAGSYDQHADFDLSKHFAFDSWQTSTMSYFSQEENTNITATKAFTLTPMMADVDAIQTLYGVSSENTGDTIFGFNSNAAGPTTNFASLWSSGTGPTMNILDSSGNDTIDLSQYTGSQVINLREGGVSDVLGGAGNLTIGQNSVIENAIGGSGNDEFYGNSLANHLSGGDGNDSIAAYDGDDTISGGTGNDVIFGGETGDDGNDEIYAGSGNDTVDAGYGNDYVVGGAGDDNISGSFGSDQLYGNSGGDILTGAAADDTLRGGDGSDFLNGGFGYDHLFGGEGKDYFFHLGIKDHGSDWIYDFSDSEGDVLIFAEEDTTATPQDFLLQLANTSGAGNSAIAEVFVTYIPTQTLLWALQDGAELDSILIQTGSTITDLLA